MSKSQAIINAVPPNGVIAPSQRMLLMLKIYKLPENRRIPVNISQPDHLNKFAEAK